MVVVIHCAPPRNSILNQTSDLTWLTFSHGLVAVWIFFCLSGYLMGKAFYAKRYSSNISGVMSFWRNRALRIFPLYYVAVLFVSIFVYPDVLKIANWGYLIRICTFTYHSFSVSPPLAFDGPLWSLSTELQFYVFVPFIYTYLKHRLMKQKYVVIAAFFIIILTFSIRYFFWISFKTQIRDHMEYFFEYLYAPLITNIDLFLCGFLVNALIQCQSTKSYETLADEKRLKILSYKSIVFKYVAILLLVLLYLFTAHHFYHQELWNLPERALKGMRTSTTLFILPPLTAVITSFFIFAFESNSYKDFQKNEKLSFISILRNPLRVLEVFGTLSYGVYIWHTPILGNINSIFTSSIPIEAFYRRLTATLILSTLLSAVTYCLVELPATRWKIYRNNRMVL